MDTLTQPATAEDLRERNARRLVDIAMGRAPHDVETVHVLSLKRPLFAGGNLQREFEQYRDIERLVATAADCAAGDRPGVTVEGAVTFIIEGGKITAALLVEDLPARIEKHKANPSDVKVMPVRRNLLAVQS